MGSRVIATITKPRRSRTLRGLRDEAVGSFRVMRWVVDRRAPMYRRDFLKKSAAAFAVSGFPRYAEQLAGAKKRVGLIGTGWYGKTDLLRLVQVAPVEVVSLCDVDKQMLSDAADLVSTRQAS